jgi:hypothetical protein
MAAGAGLYVVAARLHVPKEGFAQLDRRGLIGKYAFHAEHWRHWDRRQRRQGTQWNYHSLFW